jgi:heat shock protein HtpX
MGMLKTTLLLGAMTGLFLFVGELIGGQNGMLMALVLAGVMNFVSYFWSDKIVLASYRAQPVDREDSPDFFAIVEGLAAKAGIPMPRLYVLPDPALNAFATGRNPSHAAVAATEGILRVLSPDELEGVLAHEMAHVRNRDILIGTVAATLAGAIMMLANMARFAAIFGGGRDDREGGGGLQLLLMAILAPLGAMMVQMAVSRSREYLADETGARFCGKPEALAHALEKISGGSRQVPMQASPATAHMFIMNPLTGGGLMSLFSTHPPVEKRVERLMAMRGQILR